jgi:hypothetical protein
VGRIVVETIIVKRGNAEAAPADPFDASIT